MTEIEELPQNIHCPGCNKEFNQPVDFCDNCGFYLHPLFFPEGESAPAQDEIEPGDGSQPTTASDVPAEVPGEDQQLDDAEVVSAPAQDEIEPGDGSQPTTASDVPAEVPGDHQQLDGAEVVSAPKQDESEPGDGSQPTTASDGPAEVPGDDRHPKAQSAPSGASCLAVIGGVVIFILLWFIRIESMPIMGDVTPIQLAFLAIHAIIFGPQVGLITGLLGYAFTIGAHLYEIPDIGFMVGFALMGWLFGIYQKRVINQLNVLGIVKAWIFGILGLFLGYVYFSLILYFETNNLDFQVYLDYFISSSIYGICTVLLAAFLMRVVMAVSRGRRA